MPHSVSGDNNDDDNSSRGLFEAECHPRVSSAVKNVDGYFLQHWSFENEKARQKFVAAGFSRVTCLYFPRAQDDRIEVVCALLTVLFLIDDQLEDMSLRDGELFNQKLMPLCKGTLSPDRSKPTEWIIYDVFARMRGIDLELTDDVLEPLFVFMRAQTSRERLSIKTLGHYLVYRQGDVGQALLASLTRFSMGISLSPETLVSVADIENNCGRHISIVNDIYSFEKELRAAQSTMSEGGILCNAVQVLADEAYVDISSAKRALWVLVRGWEIDHVRMVKIRTAQDDCEEGLSAYLKGLEFHISGNEAWSRTTKRYHEPSIVE